jgi:hypothetical protein
MGCPALGVWVAFLKQPALPGKAPQTKQKIINKKSKMNQKYFKNIFFSFWGCSAVSKQLGIPCSNNKPLNLDLTSLFL